MLIFLRMAGANQRAEEPTDSLSPIRQNSVPPDNTRIPEITSLIPCLRPYTVTREKNNLDREMANVANCHIYLNGIREIFTIIVTVKPNPSRDGDGKPRILEETAGLPVFKANRFFIWPQGKREGGTHDWQLSAGQVYGSKSTQEEKL